MADSLQEQLVQAGLAEPNQTATKKKGGSASKPRKHKGKGKTRGHASDRGKPDGQPPAARDAAEQPPPKNARERIARVRRIVASQRLPRDQADRPYRFTLGRRIKEITVTAAQQSQLARGEAGVVNVQGQFDVLPAAAIEQVRATDAEAVVVLNGPDTPPSTDELEAQDERPVPDDLMW